MKKKYIALLDILGFKDLIENNTHEEVVKLFDNFRIYLQMALAKQKSTVDRLGRSVYDVSNSRINSIIISDTLIFWTNDNDPEDFFELIDCLQRFMVFCHNQAKIFLRGGITYGDFHYDNTGTIIKPNDSIMMHPLIVGKALVSAHLIETKLQFAGCIIDQNAIEQVKKDAPKLFGKRWNQFLHDKVIVEYNVPMKTCIQKAWTINWVRDFTESNRSFAKDFSSRNKSISDLEVQKKIENTTGYYNFVRKVLHGM
ncbi:MAG TPA: hypothetical protein VK151_00370 [Fluviicola sp.]|nr:hypothetical protein [Fluviicola sp.]